MLMNIEKSFGSNSLNKLLAASKGLAKLAKRRKVLIFDKREDTYIYMYTITGRDINYECNFKADVFRIEFDTLSGFFVIMVDICGEEVYLDEFHIGEIINPIGGAKKVK